MFYGIPTEKQDDLRKALALIAGIYPNQFYAQDMLICVWKLLSFHDDKKFMESFESAANDEQEKSLLWRLHVLAWAATNSLHVDGDFVECGVLKGFCSAVICKYLDFGQLDRKFYLYDTFSGLPEKTSTKQERDKWDKGYRRLDSEALYKGVCDAFMPYPNVQVVRGIVPDTFAQAVPEKISFLHIDMNSEKAEILALEALFDRVSSGGFIVLDDFGWSSNRNQNIAESKFMKDRNHSILELPTGQGVILKHGNY